MRHKLIATIAAVPILLAAVFGATPVFAAEGGSPDPVATSTPTAPAESAPVADPTATALPPTAAAPATPAPAGEVPSTPAAEQPSTEPAQSPAPEPVAADPPAPAAAPVVPSPAVAPSETPSAPVAALAPAATAIRPGPQETGYTECWALYPEEPAIDPYDKRTWPDGADCFPYQGTNATVRTTVTSVNQTTGHTITYSFENGTQTAASPFEDQEAHVLLPGETIANSYEITLAFPARDTRSIIDRDGSIITSPDFGLLARVEMATDWAAGYGSTHFYIGNSQINQSRYVTTSLSCDPLPTGDLYGQTIHTACASTVSVSPDLPMSEWYSDNWGTAWAWLSLNYAYWVSTDFKDGSSSSFVPALPTTMFTQLNWPASPTWLPTAQNKTFRVKAADTLTVTPSGLLTGAEWTEGNISDLNTYITNVPAGGTVTPEGDLEFSSEQVGNYAFNYRLEDPATGLKSRDATGDIEVYDTVVVAPPVVSSPTPPVLIPTTPQVTKPGFTVETGGTTEGSSNPIPILVALLALIAAGTVIVTWRSSRVRSKRSRAWVGAAAALVLVGSVFGIAGAAETSPGAPTLLDMKGNPVHFDSAAPSKGQEAVRPASTSTDRFMVPSIGLDVPLDSMSVAGGVITPPGFTSAYRVRDVGVPTGEASKGTVFVVMHSLRGGGVGPGNYLIDVKHGSAKVKDGATISVAGITYLVTGSQSFAKSDLASQSDLWANTPGRLVIITCLQTPSGGPSSKNVVITAIRQPGQD